jgi:hypothetical protein
MNGDCDDIIFTSDLNYAIAAAGEVGVYILDISNIENPTIINVWLFW